MNAERKTARPPGHATDTTTPPAMLLRRLAADPAFGSGPLATVAQDLLTIVIYLGAARVTLS